MKRQDRELRNVAYHEAGHAVAGFLLHRAIRYATIIPGDGTLGHVRHTDTPIWIREERNDSPRSEGWIKNQIVILLAGGYAEAKIAGRHNHVSCCGDYEAAFGMACNRSGSTEEASAYFKWLGIVAKNLIHHEHNWYAVTKVAEALIEKKRLSGKEIKHLICTAYQELVNKTYKR
jgi:ATP-dependent Zn protease